MRSTHSTSSFAPQKRKWVAFERCLIFVDNTVVDGPTTSPRPHAPDVIGRRLHYHSGNLDLAGLAIWEVLSPHEHGVNPAEALRSSSLSFSWSNHGSISSSFPSRMNSRTLRFLRSPWISETRADTPRSFQLLAGLKSSSQGPPLDICLAPVLGVLLDLHDYHRPRSRLRLASTQIWYDATDAVQPSSLDGPSLLGETISSKGTLLARSFAGASELILVCSDKRIVSSTARTKPDQGIESRPGEPFPIRQ
jgi:hypothetical protein